LPFKFGVGWLVKTADFIHVKGPETVHLPLTDVVASVNEKNVVVQEGAVVSSALGLSTFETQLDPVNVVIFLTFALFHIIFFSLHLL